jgi:hypothetical protein
VGAGEGEERRAGGKVSQEWESTDGEGRDMAIAERAGWVEKATSVSFLYCMFLG